MKLISRLLTCSFKNKIHFLLSLTLFSSLAASRRHSYNVVEPYGTEYACTTNCTSYKVLQDSRNGLVYSIKYKLNILSDV